MRQILLGLTVFCMLMSSGLQPAFAQQLPRRSVTYTFSQNSITKTQWSPDAGNSSSSGSIVPGAKSSAATGTATPGMLSNASQSASPNPGGISPSLATGSLASDLGPRPTAQQLQNPSGAYNFTHSGISHGQYTTGNTYFGSQFNSWNNLQMQPTTLDSVQTFNRTLPPVNSGAYYSPNSYLGPVNNQWSNLSSGCVTPNYLGGYIYQK